MSSQQQILPKKEADLLRSVVTHYETKQYKKGLKVAETILKRFPKHGETLCMKGLLLNSTGKKEEAVSLVKMGLTNDMRSHVCWHVYGLIHRSERNYNEAIKAYKQALRIDSGNLQILRDLSLLQIQLRDLHGFALTRQTILNLKPNQMIHWLTFALAKHLLGDLQGAVEVIDIYKRTLDRDAPELNRGFEASELALYQNDLIAKIPNNYQAALHHLELHRHLIIDEISYWTMRGSYLLYLARFEEAQDAFMKLLSMGMTEDYATHAGLMCAIVRIIDPHICATALSLRDGMGTLSTMIPLSHEQQQLLLRFYLDTLAGLYPKSNTISRIPLTLFQGEHLEKALDEYCRKNISKGVPSLGYDLSSLFLDQRADRLILLTDPADVRVHPTYLMIVRFIQTYMDELESGSSFSSHPTDQSKSTDGVREPPSTLLWTWYLRAVLHELAGEYTQAISFAERCLQHTATAVDMYELKGRLLKAAGDIDAAANVLDTGRALDKQDRYINNLTTLYLLQANREDEALERISLFTRHESPTEKNIFDMQTIWYELEAAACYRRQEKFGKGLKKYMAIEKHFEDFHEDQFDFHAYCIRKSTFRAYRDFLKWEDNLWAHEFYCVAAEEIIRIYLFIHDHPVKDNTDESEALASMSAGDRKKAKAIARKQKKKVESLEKKDNEVSQDNKTSGAIPATQTIAVDLDIDGHELLNRSPLEEAKRFLATLVKNAPHRIATWILQYDLAARRGKQLMALQALFKAKAIDSASGDLFSRTVDFLSRFPVCTIDDINKTIDPVLKSGVEILLGGKLVSLQEFVAIEVEKINTASCTPLSVRLAVSESSHRSGVWSRKEASSFLVASMVDGHGATFDVLRKTVLYLEELGDDVQEDAETWKSMIRQRFPFTKDPIFDAKNNNK